MWAAGKRRRTAVRTGRLWTMSPRALGLMSAIRRAGYACRGVRMRRFLSSVPALSVRARTDKAGTDKPILAAANPRHERQHQEQERGPEGIRQQVRIRELVQRQPEQRPENARERRRRLIDAENLALLRR